MSPRRIPKVLSGFSRASDRSKKSRDKDSHLKSETYPSAEGLNEEDVFVVSYPRSGNTLVRTLLARMMFSEDSLEGLKDLDVLVPSKPSRTARRKRRQSPL